MSSIGNLLAQISGGSSSQAPSSRTNRTSQPERRVEPNMSTTASRPTSRPTIGVNSFKSTPVSSSRPVQQRPTPSARPIPSRPPPRPEQVTRPATTARNGVTKPSGGFAQTSSSALKPTPRPVQLTSSSAPPRKGSYAEIMARAQRAQQVMGQVGKIQHKKVEKGLSKKERTEQMERLKSEQKATSAKKMAASRTSKVRGGTVTDANNRKATSAVPSKSQKAPEPEKKTRKPPPSTGYTGTARPSAPSKLKKHTPGGAILETSSYSRSSSTARCEGEDEDMDGFIDDEEQEDSRDRIRYGRRYVYDDYDSDGSSDMEVGLNEIDHEEAIAERIARQDDRMEEERERARKAEKERRKRETLRRP
ncbi:hypothetical protein Cpir12675_000150 [Ceratocystis pirilliformis]|uniref:SPT2 chromatin protein n=1 Tax=Ceratocystis pirilliformis TaxID=259994 RepID=A0ABR3ZRC7_9PEZI